MEENKNTDAFRPAGGRLLQQSVLKHIRRKAEGVEEGAAIGYDAAIFQNKEHFTAQAVGAMPTSRIPEGYPLTAGELAWIMAENQLATAGVTFGTAGDRSSESLITAQVLLVAGVACPEEVIRREMQRLAAFSSERGCPIVGGNTLFHGEGSSCLIQVVMTAGIGKKMGEGRRRPKEGDRVFFLGETGCLGADLLVCREEQRLRERFSDSYIRTMRYEKETFSITAQSRAALEAGAVHLHDISNGGVHAALYQLAMAADTGIEVRHEGLTIRQSVIELSEYLGINPYQLLGTGGVLAVVPEEKTEIFCRTLEKKGIRAGDAGRLTREKARVVRAESFHMERYLNLPEGDALD